MKKFYLTSICFAILTLANSQTNLIVSGDTWKYHNGSDPGATWKNVGFNDASWSSGPSQLGYGDGDEATVIPTNYPTSYFRRVINVGSPGTFTGGYSLSVKRDDGIVVYINGTQVYSNNMPASPNYATWASSTCADDGGTWLNIVLPAGTLVAGNNTIAAEVHQVSASSSDVTFDLTLQGLVAGLPTLTRGPYLQMGTSTGMIVKWRTNVASNSEVRYGTNPASLSLVATNATSSVNHEVQLTGLTPNTKYYYSIGTIGGSVIQGDTTNHFYTHPSIGTEYELDVWVTGDCGTGYATQTSVMNQFLNHVGNKYIDAWLLVGDNAYNSGFDSEYQSGFFAPYQNSRLMKQTTIWPAPGNHDYYSAPNLGDRNFDYYQIFNMPTTGQLGGVASGTEAFYSYNIGNVHFVSLDSYGEEAGDKMYDTTGAQSIWLKQDLAANTQKWTVLYWHHPPYTKGSHNSDTEGDLVDIRQKFIRMVERFDVDLIICGHSHCYERSKLMKGHYGNEASFNAATHHKSSSSAKYDGTANSCPYVKDSDHPNNEGVVYMVSGSAGKFGGTSSGYPHNAMYYSNAANGGSTYLKFNQNRLDVKFISDGGVIQDQFTIMKDVNQVTHYNINSGDPVNMDASWPGGQYSWPHNGATTEAVVANPTSSTNFTVTDQYGCIRDSFIVSVTPGTLPNPSFSMSDNNICVGESVTYTNTSINATSFSWDFPMGSPLNGSTSPIVVTYNTAGTYTTTLTAANANGSASTTQTITVNALPTNTTSNGGPYCAGQNIQLNATGGAFDYDWTGPLSYNQPNTQNPVRTGATTAMSGVYTCTITNAAGCTTTSTTTVTVNTLPSQTTSNTGPYCVGNTIQLNATAGASDYDWTGPNSFVANNTQNPSIASSTTAMAGAYTCTITNASGCSTTSTTIVAINSLPTNTTSNTGPYCVGATIQLNATSGAIDYDWTGPNSFVANNTQNPSIASSTTAMAGIYTCTITNAAGCTTISTNAVTVNANPSAPIITPGGPTTFCSGGSVNLSSSYSSGNTWNTSATTQVINVNSNGTYTVTYTDGNGCTSSASQLVTVNSNPSAPIITPGGPITFCSGGSVNLSSSYSTGNTWNTSATTQVINVNINGTYTVTYTDLNGCTSSASQNVTVNNLPNATAGNTGPYCPGNTIQLTANGGNGYNWSGPSSFSENVQNPTIASAAAMHDGIYTVTVTDVNGCSASATTTVVVANPGSANATNGGPYCEGETVNLGSVAGGTGYNWTGPLSFTDNVQNPIITESTLSMSGSYTVIVTFAGGCTSSGTTSIVVNATPSAPVITPSGSTTFCVGGSVNLTSSYSSGNVWNTTETNNTITVTNGGTYAVTHTDGNGCSSSSGILINVNSLPTVTVPNFGVVCESYTPVTLTGGNPNGGTYSGTGVTSGQFNPGTAGIGTFNITYTYTDINGCTNSAVSNIEVNGCAGIEENQNKLLTAAYPNPFDNQITVSFSLPVATDVKMELLDMNGKVIGIPLTKQMMNAGNHVVAIQSIDFNLRNGMYLIRLVTNTKTELIKITYTGN